MNTRITLLGAGNMANAIVAGLIANGHSKEAIYVLARDPIKQKKFVDTYGVISNTDYQKALLHAEVLIVAVKPQSFAELFQQIKSALLSYHGIVVSIMSGIRLAALEERLPNLAIIRAMPNTPSRVQQGITLLQAGKHVLPTQLAQVEYLFNALGQAYITPNERAFEQLTALTGCGPAFVFHLVSALAKAMQELTPSIDCLPFAQQTFIGALALMQQEKQNPETLIHQVCSKGGMTIEAMKILQAEDLQAVFTKALQAAITRGDELAQYVEIKK